MFVSQVERRLPEWAILSSSTQWSGSYPHSQILNWAEITWQWKNALAYSAWSSMRMGKKLCNVDDEETKFLDLLGHETQTHFDFWENKGWDKW